MFYMNSTYRFLRSSLLVAVCVLPGGAAVAQVRAPQAPTCLELERGFEVLQADATPTQINLVLFSAAP